MSKGDDMPRKRSKKNGGGAIARLLRQAWATMSEEDRQQIRRSGGVFGGYDQAIRRPSRGDKKS